MSEALAEIAELERDETAARLVAAVSQRDFAAVRALLASQAGQETADLITELPVEDQVLVFRVLPRDRAAETFEYLSLETQESLLKAMAQEDVAAILNEMSPDDRTLMLEELPAAATKQLLALLTPEERAVAVRLLGYPEGSIGRLMTPSYVAVREAWTVAEVLDHVRLRGADAETLSLLFVVDGQGVLVDDLRIRQILLAPLATRVADLLDRNFVSLKASEDQETAVAVFRRTDRAALPVTDTAGVLIGIVTVDDVLDVAEEAATEDIQRIGGSQALEEPYVDVGLRTMVRKRAPWLVVLFAGEMFTASAMGVFEHEIQRAVVLALFIPLIISSGGNSGSQASTLVIRALALGELRLSDAMKVLRRELASGLLLGAILGTIGFARVALGGLWGNHYGPHWFPLALTLGVTLVGVVTWGTLMGAMLPLLLQRLGLDPATSSAPFVATLVDVTGLLLYFTVAALLLRGTLL